MGNQMRYVRPNLTLSPAMPYGEPPPRVNPTRNVAACHIDILTNLKSRDVLTFLACQTPNRVVRIR